VYLPFISFWMLFESVRRRSPERLVRWLAIVVLASGLAAVKLLPTMEFTQAYPRAAEQGGYTPLAFLPTMFGDPRQAKYYQADRDKFLPDDHFATAVPAADAASYPSTLRAADLEFKFQEYGCYVGVIGLMLVMLGVSRTLRRFWPLYLAGGVAFVTILGSRSPVDLWAGLQQLPMYDQLRVPSRFLAALLFVLAVASAFGLTSRSASGSGTVSRRSRLALVLVAGLYLELAAMGAVLFSDVFVVPPSEIRAHTDFAQRCDVTTRLHQDVMDSSMYPCLIANSGDLGAYENLSVTAGRVRTVRDPDYRGEVYLESGRGSATIQVWTMARLRLIVAADGPDALVLNQNFHPSWTARRIDADGPGAGLAVEAGPDGLVSVPISAGAGEIELRFRPASVVVGAWISAAAAAVCVLILAAGWRATRRSRV
jgi:hypothetical protein